jgi:hypothetical protein
MEGMNPFWWTAVLLATYGGAVAIGLTLLAGLVWLIGRSNVARILFLVLLACTLVIGVIYVTAIVMIDSKWP